MDFKKEAAISLPKNKVLQFWDQMIRFGTNITQLHANKKEQLHLEVTLPFLITY
jgi:hypothetical protein